MKIVLRERYMVREHGAAQFRNFSAWTAGWTYQFIACIFGQKRQ
jgi:hypothetical protein